MTDSNGEELSVFDFIETEFDNVLYLEFIIKIIDEERYDGIGIHPESGRVEGIVNMNVNVNDYMHYAWSLDKGISKNAKRGLIGGLFGQYTTPVFKTDAWMKKKK
jgi:hypothetical protein